MRLNGRLKRLENEAQERRPAATWQMVILTEPTEAEIEEARAVAVAVGWESGDGPYAIIVRQDR